MSRMLFLVILGMFGNLKVFMNLPNSRYPFISIVTKCVFDVETTKKKQLRIIINFLTSITLKGLSFREKWIQNGTIIGIELAYLHKLFRRWVRHFKSDFETSLKENTQLFSVKKIVKIFWKFFENCFVVLNGRRNFLIFFRIFPWSRTIE